MPSFMTPEYYQGKIAIVTLTDGEGFVIPADILGDTGDDLTDAEIETVDGILCRLSASGYLDCTDWDGPHESLEDARQELSSIYDVCSACGEDMNESDIGIECAECAGGE